MEHSAETKPQKSTCNVCGTETETACVAALDDGPVLCLNCYNRCFLSDFDLVFEAE
jgi:hypothetical protein